MALRATPPLEKDVQRACLDWLALHRWPAWRVNQSGVPLHDGKGGFRPGPTTGMSDIHTIVPGRGIAVWIECKRPMAASRTTIAQDEFMAQVRRAGGVAIVARSTKDLEPLLALK